MVHLGSNLEVANFVLLICTLPILWRGVSCLDAFNGGRKTLELATSLKPQNDVEQMLTMPSSVCRIVHQEGNTKHCFGVLVSSRWLLTAVSCAPKDLMPPRNDVRAVCGSPNRSPALIQNEFVVVEVHPIKSAAVGETQEPDMSLMKLDTDAPGPFVKFEENGGPDFYILEQSELMRTFFNVSDLRMEQTLGSWHKSNIDLIGLPLITNSSALNNEDASENALQQITTCCLATACQLFKDGLNICTFRRLTPREYKSVCRTTGTCNEVHSAFGMTPSFHRSLSSSPTNDTCTGSPKIVMIRNCRPIPPFLQPCCSDETLTQLKDIEDKRKTFKDMVKQNNASLLEEWILCSEFKVNSMDSNKDTLLHNAAFKDANDTAKVLCELNIDTELKNANGNTPVITAAQRSNLKVLKVILKSCKNVNVNATDSTHKTALHYAAAKNSSAMAQVLCNTSIDTEIKSNGGRTALLAAAYQSRLEVLKVIVISCKNVNVSATDSAHKTALHYAAEKNSSTMAQVLCNTSIDTEIRSNSGRTALLAAAFQNKLEVLKVIMNNCTNAKLDAKANRGKTALHYAAKKNATIMAQVLCNAGIDASAQNYKNETALVVASIYNNTEPLRVIVNSCANVNLDATDNKNSTALHYAVRKCNPEMAQVLVGKGADRSIRDNKGKTPLKMIRTSPEICGNEIAEELGTILRTANNQTADRAA